MLRTFFLKKKHVVYLGDGLQLRNLPHHLPPSLPAAVLDMPEEIEESISVAFQRVLLRMGCTEIYLRHYWNDPHRFFLGGKNGPKQERGGAKSTFGFFGGDEPGTACVFQVHELLHRECECGHEGSGAREQHSLDEVGAGDRYFILHL
ncbi:MAG: hypothetical protein RL040_1330 [Bacteroidota bacterium]